MTKPKSTTQTRIFSEDIQRLNALKRELQDKYPFNLSHQFLIMMLLNAWEEGAMTVQPRSYNGARNFSSKLAAGGTNGVNLRLWVFDVYAFGAKNTPADKPLLTKSSAIMRQYSKFQTACQG
ncbi:MAG: hypothetical protein LBU89_03735, partial [Fibromonadaceae bacterium]|nr:hypothetical protein [Fibromonadaceae bacterium]